jgi:alkylation response protein AidB-like acyl-CoA dehydrogenase
VDFELSEEQKMIRDMCRQFTDEVIAPRAEEVEKTGNYAYGVMDRMSALGMMGIPFPERYGGGGGDWVSMNLCIEEISRGDVGLGAMLDVTTLCGYELETFGTEEQKVKWLVPIAEGGKSVPLLSLSPMPVLMRPLSVPRRCQMKTDG